MPQMTIDEHSAAVDTDFINHVAEINRTSVEVAKLLAAVLAELKLQAVVHPLVYKYEIITDAEKIRNFFSEGIIALPTFDDIFQGSAERKEYYKFLIPELYNALHGKTPFPEDADIFTHWKRQKSLGEIHSTAMCLVCGCGIFLSDDGDSKILAQTVQQRSMGKITVYNRKEVLTASQEVAISKFPRKDRQAFTHGIKK